jgi:hypothetical protein
VEAVLASETLARSEQMRSFLRYVCQRTLAGHGREINEYSVAVEALGKPAGFTPGEDSSVRRAVYELRQKLQKYYESEKPDAVVRIELPKGSYTPRFIESSFKPVVLAKNRQWNWVLGVALGISVLIGASLAVTLAADRTRVDRIVREVWRPLAPSAEQVLISEGTTLHLIVRPYMDVVAAGLPKYPALSERYPLFRQHRPLDGGTELFMHPVDNSVQMGHAEALALTATTLSLMGRPYRFCPSEARRLRHCGDAVWC